MSRANRAYTRVSRTEVAERVTSVVTLLLAGASTPQILAYCEDHFQTKPRQAQRYLAEARQRLTDQLYRDQGEELGKAIARYEQIYRRAIKLGRLRTALTAQDSLTRLFAARRVSDEDRRMYKAVKLLRRHDIDPAQALELLVKTFDLQASHPQLSPNTRSVDPVMESDPILGKYAAELNTPNAAPTRQPVLTYADLDDAAFEDGDDDFQEDTAENNRYGIPAELWR